MGCTTGEKWKTEQGGKRERERDLELSQVRCSSCKALTPGKIPSEMKTITYVGVQATIGIQRVVVLCQLGLHGLHKQRWPSHFTGAGLNEIDSILIRPFESDS
jgi:hypothetical protein